MENTFYSDFDWEQKEPPKKNPDDVRTPFQIDRDRIVFSYAFRRLQSKTQVFQSGEFDFYRNRLTHSIEVAKIARSITDYLNKKSELLSPNFFIDSDLVEAVGMAHDLGHPPFGHIGERKLNSLMAENGGFEGNAQTLRILTRLFYSKKDENIGMNPSRALIDGILKYKKLYSDLIQKDDNNHLIYPKHHFIYDQDSEWLSFALDNKLSEVEQYCESENLSINKFKSLECEIMDWSDDTAYSINDIIDSIQAGYLTPIKIEQWAENKTLSGLEQRYLEELISVISKSRHEAFLNKQIGTFIHAVKLIERNNPLSTSTNRYRFGITIDEEVKQKATLYKRIAVDLIFRSTPIHRIEYKGSLILEKLFDTLRENYIEKPANEYLNLIPQRFSSQLTQSADKNESMRILCDTISEMTDALAIRTHKQLFDPDFGSILDVL